MYADEVSKGGGDPEAEGGNSCTLGKKTENSVVINVFFSLDVAHDFHYYIKCRSFLLQT